MLHNNKFRLPGRFIALLGLIGIPVSALGEEAKTGHFLEEVTVTAQRTEESIQDVPIAVTAFTGDMLEYKQIIGTSDLQMNTPNVSFTATNFGSSSLSIRGIGRLVISSSGEAGVSIHLNEIPVGTNLNAVEYYDMERVEVLRGPQGTLFGRNATGGAINMITAKPTFDNINGFVDAEYGDYGHQRLKGAVNLPVADNFAFRLAGMTLKRDGFIDNVAHGQVGADGSTLPGINSDVDGRDIYSFRATAKWDINDDASLWVMYSKFSEDDDRARITNQVCKANTLPTTGCLPDEFGFEGPHLGTTTGGIFGGMIGAVQLGDRGNGYPGTVTQYDFPKPAGMGFRDMHTDFEPVFQNDEDLWSFGFSYNFGEYNFSLQGATQTTEFLSRQDYLMDVGASLGATPLNPTGYWPTSDTGGKVGGDYKNPNCNFDDGTAGIFGGCILPVNTSRIFAYDQSDSESEYWTIEGKIASSFDGPVNFVVGASAYDGESAGDYYVIANTLDMVGTYGVAGLGFPPLYPTLYNSTGDPDGSNFSDGWAAFGEVYYQFNEDVKLTIGLRYNEDNKETRDTGVLFNAIGATSVGSTLPGFLVGLGLLDPNYLTNGGDGQHWTRQLNLLLGPLGATTDADLALAKHHGVSQAQWDAALLTPAYSAERFAISSMVPPTPGFNETRALTGSPSEASWEEYSGRIGVDWSINENTMAYAFYNRGYKPGGFNPPINPQFQATSAFTFDAEQIDSIEVGMKNTLLNGDLMLNGTFFLYDYSDLQVTRIANNTSLNDNIDANIMGAEIEALWIIESIPNLVFDASYSWLDTEVDGAESVDPLNRTAGNPDWILLENIDPGSTTAVNYVAVTSQVLPLVDAALASNGALSDANGATPPGVTYPNGIPAYFSRSFLETNGVQTSNGLSQSIDGKSLPNAPENTIHLGAAYTFNLAVGDLTARWDYYWQDDSYAREFNSKGDAIDSWDQHNASLELRSKDDRWMVRAWVRNIQDEDNVTGKYLTSDTSGFYRNYFLTDPRMYGASVRYTFGAM